MNIHTFIRRLKRADLQDPNVNQSPDIPGSVPPPVAPPPTSEPTGQMPEGDKGPMAPLPGDSQVITIETFVKDFMPDKGPNKGINIPILHFKISPKLPVAQQILKDYPETRLKPYNTWGTIGIPFGSFVAKKEEHIQTIQLLDAKLPEIEQKFNIRIDPSGIQVIKDRLGMSPAAGTASEAGSAEATSQEIQQFKFDEKNTAEGSWALREEMKKFVSGKLDELADQVNTAAGQDFIKNFLRIRKSFYNYTFMNQLMIMFQNLRKTVDPTTGKETFVSRSGYVDSPDRWEKMHGRKVKDEEKAKGMDVFVPVGGSYAVKPYIIESLIAVLDEYMSKFGRNATDLRNKDQYNQFVTFLDSKAFDPTKQKGKGARKLPKGMVYKSSVIYVKDIINTKKMATVGMLYDYLSEKRADGDKISKAATNFLIKPGAFDMDQTIPIPGQENKDPQKVIEEVDTKWHSVNTMETQQTTSLIQLAVSAAEKGIMVKGIDTTNSLKDNEDKLTPEFAKIIVKRGQDTGHAGGWSRGVEVAISKDSGGEREFSTVVHELAHSILHFRRGKMNKPYSDADGRTVEYEAEATAYIVMSHYGFTDLSYAANYIALHKGDGGQVKGRMANILYAASAIINGIESEKMNAFGEQKKVSSFNWFFKRCIMKES